MNENKLVQAIKSFEQVVISAERLGIRLKSIENYRLGIRAAFRGLWSGAFDFFDFYAAMDTTIQRGFSQAWREGALRCGIDFDELSRDELNALRSEIVRETQFIDGVAGFIEANSRDNGGKLSVVMQRAELWIQAYDRVANRAQSMACKDQKLKWVLNPAEHCSSCLKLEGKVKRASFWTERGVYPKAWDKLDCKQGCKCDLVPTTEPLSRGPLPNLP